MITILHGDNLDLLPTLAPQSVQAIVTSPPYFGLRNYGIPPSVWPQVAYAPMAALPDVVIPEQTVCLGLEADPLAYVAHLVHVFRLARPALRDDGVLLLNLGDSYAGGGGFYPDAPSNRNGGSISSRQDDGSSSKPAGANRIVPGLKNKDLLCIPHRVAMALQADGWYLRMDAIWHKPNAMPESVKDRPTRAHEYVFLLAKSARYFWDADAVAEPSTGRIGATWEERKAAGEGSRRGYSQNAPTTASIGGVSDTRNLRSVWSISTKPLADAHYAPMPEALAERCIKASTKAGDTVLDMYGGSGTTSRTAERLQRHGIHIDLAYQDIAERRTDGVQVEMLV